MNVSNIDESSSAESSPPAAIGGDLRLSLACPDCGLVGWVEWKSLKRGLRCPQCKCQFLVGKNGKTLAHAEMPQVRYSCPRCGQAGSIPSFISIRKAMCGACKLPLEAGPDQQLHGAKEAARLRKEAALPEKPGIVEKMTRFCTTDDGRIKTGNLVILAIGLVVALITGTVAARSLFGSSPDGMARQFTYACLAGDWNYAESFLEDNDVARVEFTRWRAYYFSSILDKHRPAGDRVGLKVELTAETPQTRDFRIVLTSPVLGERPVPQLWREIDGDWRFDVVATLAQLSGGR